MRNLLITLAFIGTLFILSSVITLVNPDKTTNPDRETPTHFYGSERTDPNRKVHKYDYENNRIIYEDELPKETTKVTKIYTIKHKKTLDDYFNDKVEEYVEDNKDEINEELNN